MTLPERSHGMIGEITWGDGSVLFVVMLWNLLIMCRYQRAFVDFFEDQLVSNRYDWKLLLDEYLFGGKEPLINGLVAGREYQHDYLLLHN
jgi:hypothetical protein